MAAEQTKREGKFLILFSLTELQSKHFHPLATNYWLPATNSGHISEIDETTPTANQ